MAKPTALPALASPAQPDIALTDGEFTQIPVSEDDIGAELLPILSKGLYTDPLHCVREYVQNSVDSGAKKVTIKITGNSVIVHDTGNGMTKLELIQARRFGVSSKNVRDFVGFRGIGIYSGYDLCNRLLITTQQQGAKHAYVMEFDFGRMKQQLASDAQSGKRTPLAKLLAAHSRFTQEQASASTKGTTVQLEELSDFHIAQLRDRDKLKQYILKNLPIDFDDGFDHREEIVARLKEEVPGYRAVKIVLESDADPRDVVVRPAIPDLEKPTMGPIANKAGDTIAYYWACLHKPGKDGKRGKLPDEYGSYSGFVYKVKGFSIGDNSKLQRIFKTGSSTLYRWYTGEIYVIDPAVIPNTERDDFETNAAYESLQARVKEKLKELEKKASKYQEEERAGEKYAKHDARVKGMWHAVRAGAYERPDFYSEITNIVDELTAQRAKLATGKKDWGKAILKSAEELRDKIRDAIENPGKSKDKKKAGRARAEETSDDTSTSGTSKGAGNEETPRRTVSELVEEAGIALSSDATNVLIIVDESIAAVLGDGSDEHRAVLAEIEANLAREL